MTLSRTLAAFISALLLTVSIAGASHAGSRDEIKEIVIREASAAGIPPSLALAVAKVESDFQSRALGPNGARGVMQIMPGTAETRFGIGGDALWDVSTNVRIGVDLLAQLIGRYDGDWNLALSHYKSGRVRDTGDRAAPLPATQKFIESVLRWQRLYAAQAQVWRTLKARTAALERPRGKDKAPPGPRREHTVDPDIRSERPTLDDFGASIERKRRRYAPRLDDLTPIGRAGAS